MEVIEYYKLSFIFKVYIRELLLETFKNRWFVESNESVWKSNRAHGEIIKKVINKEIYEKYREPDDDDTLENGRLEKFPIELLYILLVHSDFKKLDKNEIVVQNKTLDSIHELYLISIRYCLTMDKSYNEIYNESIQLIQQLNNINQVSISIEEIEKGIQRRINMKSNSCIGLPSFNEINEAKANEIKLKGNQLYEMGQHKPSQAQYHDELQLEGLSNWMRATLNLNTSASLYEFSLEYSKFKSPRLPNHEDYSNLENAKMFTIQAITLSPTWGKAYYRLAQINSRISEYQFAKKYFEIVDTLDETYKSSTITKIKHCTDQIKLHNSGSGSSGRDFKKEALQLIDKLDCLTSFKKQQIQKNKEFVKSNISSEMLSNFNGDSKRFGVPLDVIIDKYFCYVAKECKQFEKEHTFYSRCVGAGSHVSDAYIYLAEFNKSDKGGIECSDKFTLSLYLQASLLPLKFNVSTVKAGKLDKSDIEIIPHYSDNFSTVIANLQLGLIFKHGLYGMDIDLEKAMYYLQFSVDNSDGKIRKENFYNMAFFSLGHMYFKGYNHNNQIDIKKAKSLWTEGLRLGDYRSYNLDFLNDNF